MFGFKFMTNEEIKQKEKVLILAERVKLLFGFCANLIPHKKMLKNTYALAEDKEMMSLSMAPILGAFGQDYESVHNEARIKKERAKALYNLIDCLDRTEKERLEWAEKQNKKQEGLAQLRRALGL